jgi:hypothetical protein
MSAVSHEGEQGTAPTHTGDNMSNEKHQSSASPAQEGATTVDDAPLPEEEAPPLPEEDAPPLPDEPPPDEADDGWEPKWEPNAQAWYFVNTRTGLSQWENPRVPAATAHSQAPYDRFANFYHFICPFPA